MRRRSHLIADYLRAHDPVGTSAFTTPTVEPELVQRTARRSRWRVAVPAAGGLAALGVVAALVGPSLVGNDSLLSPEAAVAAVAKDLKGGGILHWRLTADQTNLASSPLGRHDHTTFDLWTDLDTGASHGVLDVEGLTDKIDDTPEREEQWWDGKRTAWAGAAPSMVTDRSRITIIKTVYPDSPRLSRGYNPVDVLAGQLARATAGKATLGDGGFWHGVPVTTVTERVSSGSFVTTTSSWIVRGPTPRPLRATSQTRDTKGRFVSSNEQTTTTWRFYPGDDAAARRHVVPPHFDPARYDVKNSSMNGPQSGSGTGPG